MCGAHAKTTCFRPCPCSSFLLRFDGILPFDSYCRCSSRSPGLFSLPLWRCICSSATGNTHQGASACLMSILTSLFTIPSGQHLLLSFVLLSLPFVHGVGGFWVNRDLSAFVSIVAASSVPAHRAVPLRVRVNRPPCLRVAASRFRIRVGRMQCQRGSVPPAWAVVLADSRAQSPASFRPAIARCARVNRLRYITMAASLLPQLRTDHTWH